MANTFNTNKSETKKVTNYETGMFKGEQFPSMDKAIQAGALSYARAELTNMMKYVEELKTAKAVPAKLTDTQVLQALYNVKKQAIIDNIGKRESAVDTTGLVL